MYSYSLDRKLFLKHCVKLYLHVDGTGEVDVWHQGCIRG
jgi:hypothetical protein